jgi:autotransporter adhesin
MGNNVNAGNASNAVVLGNNSTAVDNAVSVGSDANKRQIKYVADGTDDSDAATMGQLRKVGAGAAALAALHPLDTEDKFGAAVGVGHYDGSTAMAAGLFYRPTDNVMMSLGGSMGNGENLVNLGVSFALGKGGTPSKKAMLRQLDALSAENAAIRAENAEIKAQNEKLEARLAAIEAMLAEK